MQDSRYGNQKSLQQHHILGCLAKWRATKCLAKLDDSVLDSSGQDELVMEEIILRRKTTRWVLTLDNAFVRWQIDTLHRF